MSRSTELSTSAQTAYAQVFEAALARELARSVANVAGSFVAKTVKGSKYWYFQYTDISGDLRQIYVGPDNEPVRTLVASTTKEEREARAGPLERLAHAAVVLGNAAVVPRQLRVLGRLADYGFFKAGGVLVGTHAFVAYGNMLGVKWKSSERTQEVDFAHAGKSVSLALPSTLEVQTHQAIESLGMGFLPVADIAAKTGGAYVIPKEPEFRLDFLTTLHRGGQKPFEHPQLHVTLQPVKFMEYSLQDVSQAALLSNAGAVLVNVPSPERFALHKLLVAGERTGTYAVKARKDIAQATALLEVLRERMPTAVHDAWRDLLSRGRGWATRARRGLKTLEQAAPDLQLAVWLRAGESL